MTHHYVRWPFFGGFGEINCALPRLICRKLIYSQGICGFFFAIETDKPSGCYEQKHHRSKAQELDEHPSFERQREARWFDAGYCVDNWAPQRAKKIGSTALTTVSQSFPGCQERWLLCPVNNFVPAPPHSGWTWAPSNITRNKTVQDLYRSHTNQWSTEVEWESKNSSQVALRSWFFLIYTHTKVFFS